MRICYLIPYHAARLINYLIAIYLNSIQSETCPLRCEDIKHNELKV